MAVLDAKKPVAYASTAPISTTKAEALVLEGKAPLLPDGGAGLSSGTRLLFKNQVSASQNGIWEVIRYEAVGGTGKVGGEGKVGVGDTWETKRPEDADSGADVTDGMLVPVGAGDINAKTSWIQRTADPIEVGTTPLAFEELWASHRPETSGNAKIKWAGGTQFSEGKIVEHGLGVAPRSVTLTAETTPGSLVEANLAENPNVDVKQFTIVAYAALLAPAKGTEVVVQWTASA
jgi:hypothetical protein